VNGDSEVVASVGTTVDTIDDMAVGSWVEMVASGVVAKVGTRVDFNVGMVDEL
jgi:hypothetical protein